MRAERLEVEAGRDGLEADHLDLSAPKGERPVGGHAGLDRHAILLAEHEHAAVFHDASLKLCIEVIRCGSDADPLREIRSLELARHRLVEGDPQLPALM